MNIRYDLWNFVIPMAGSIYAVRYFLDKSVGWIEVSCMFLFYILTGLGITLGFHRYFTHKSFSASFPLKVFLAITGSMAFQGPIISWVADHRRHHRYSDKTGDPHSPHTLPSVGWTSRLTGLIHAHVGWLFTEPVSSYSTYTKDLLQDTTIVVVERSYFLWSGLSLALPWLYGAALGGPEHAMGCLLLGGCVRATVVQHLTWSVNSLTHIFGYQTFNTGDQSRNNFPIAMLTLGEGWHNNHHAFPRSAFHGLKAHELDPTGLIIKGMEKIGMVSHVIYPPKAVLEQGSECGP